MGIIGVITSGKGGTGKSTVSVGLGAALAARGKSVLLIDGDAGLRCLDMMLGVENRMVYDLSDIFSGNCEPIRAIYASPLYDGLSLIPSPSALDKMCSPSEMRHLMTGLAQHFDHVMIDCPAGIGEGFECASAAAQRALVVSTGDTVCARDAGVVSRMLEQAKIPARLVINRLRYDLVVKGKLPDIDEIIDTAEMQLFGVVPDDDNLTIATTGGMSIPDDCRAAVCFKNMACRYLGEAVPLTAIGRA